MTEQFDVIVVGGGHNGLVCANLLAKAGKSVLVLEANEQAGGAAVTQSFADGYSVSSGAHLLYGLQPQVERDLGLKVRLASDNMSTIALSDDGKHIRIKGSSVQGVGDNDRPRCGISTSRC
ncbi:MAG: FAD-dependent oxidoreductase [Woeseiaceae bacterium]|nr:FAD-dependent oxidoreductase [Woeseiaceae bacterium]